NMIASGGTGGHTININTLHAQSVARLFANKGSALVATLNRAMRHRSMLYQPPLPCATPTPPSTRSRPTEMGDIGVLPKLAGQGWSVKKTPTFQTRIQRAVSGRELRALDYPYPLWQFELTWEALGDGSAAIGSLLTTDLRTLMGFFLACQ